MARWLLYSVISYIIGKYGVFMAIGDTIISLELTYTSRRTILVVNPLRFSRWIVHGQGNEDTYSISKELGM